MAEIFLCARWSGRIDRKRKPKKTTIFDKFLRPLKLKKRIFWEDKTTVCKSVNQKRLRVRVCWGSGHVRRKEKRKMKTPSEQDVIDFVPEAHSAPIFYFLSILLSV